jgi:hypothetical protein
MSVKKFKFVSPGIFLNEIDNSQLAREPEQVGPTIIGRLQKGPGLVPVRIDSMSEFIEVFGNPIPGGKGGDVWREGNETAPTYAAYAAQAFLRNTGPVNVVRLLGTEDPQAAAAGAAGWTLDNSLDANDTTKSSVYGLYLFSTGGVDRRGDVHGQHSKVQSTSEGLDRHRVLSGTLGAIFYLQAGTLALSGNLAHHAGTRGNFPGGRVHGTGSHVLIKSSDPSKMEFNALLTDGTKAERRVTFNFDRNSDKYIRKVFNTNPTLTNGDTTQTAGLHKYFLGETFDRFIKDHHGHAGVSGSLHQGHLSADSSLSAMIVPLHGTTNGLVRQLPNQDSKTPWIFGQDLNTTGDGYKATAMQKLIRFCGINDGGWNTRYLKVSITDVKPGNDIDPYGTFSVLVRRISDNDARPFVLERFSQCSLNPNSNNYIGRKVGDQYREWDDVDKRYRVYGNYPNQSSFFRVIIDQDVDNGVTDPALIPFGFYGPPRYKTGNIITHDQKIGTGYGAFRKTGTAAFVHSSGSVTTAESVDAVFNTTDAHKGAKSAGHTNMLVLGLPTRATASLVYPTLPLRLTASAEGLSNAKNSFFGVSTYRTPTDTKFDPSFVDVTRRLGGGFLSKGIYDASSTSTKVETSFMFTLDDLVVVSKSGSVGSNLGKHQGSIAPSDIGTAVYVSGSRANSISYTAKRGGYKDLVKAGFAKFTVPVYGGFDGFDITEKEPFRNSKFSSGDETTSYEIASLKRAVDAVSDPEVVEMNALSIPGITNTRVTNHVIRTCEDRADALAVIDIENGGYIPSTENKDDFKTRVQNSKVRNAVDSIENRGLDTSYACAFYPWVKISDQINGRQVWVPPSVTALGTFGSTEARSELWFAPAGFTRGGLSEGAGGIPVLAVSQRVSSRERDELYEANINPIAQFPAEGIVVFGQKTLQATPSALDRINVRRLMIYVKKEISRRAATLLFDQNVQATWDRFRGSVEPFLDSVKSRFGLTEFKVVLDETTTTPDLIDRNILYAKIFLKPARAIEFIAIDFVITNSGASFED